MKQQEYDFSSMDFWANNYVVRRSVGQPFIESLVEVHKPSLISDTLIAMFDNEYGLE